MITHYQILSIKEDATVGEIKKAYRDKVMLFHPDINKHPDASKIFISIQRAYEILGDPEKRRRYDEFLRAERAFIKTGQINRAAANGQNIKKKNPVRDNVSALIIIIVALTIISCLLYDVGDKRDNSTKKTESPALLNTTNRPFSSTETEEQLTGYKYYMDTKGEVHEVHANKVQEYLKKNPSAKEMTREGLLAVESKRAKENTREKKKGNKRVNTPSASLNYTRPLNGSSPYNTHYGSGVIDKNSKGEIEIINGTNQDALVLFYRTDSKKNIRNIYVRANERATINHVPQGNLKMKTFYGNEWAVDLDNGHGNPKGGFTKDVSFSDMASYERFDMNWEESYSGISYPAYSVTLHKVRDGNLQTRSIAKSDFFN